MPPKVQKKVPAHILQKLAGDKLEDFIAEVEKRYKRAKAILEEQSEDTQDAVMRMADTIHIVFPKRMWVAKHRGSTDRVVFDIPDEIHEKLSIYIAFEAMKDLALMDIRVQRFHFTNHCADCNMALKPTKRKKAKR